MTLDFLIASKPSFFISKPTGKVVLSEKAKFFDIIENHQLLKLDILPNGKLAENKN